MSKIKYKRIKAYLTKMGEPAYRYKQVTHAIFKNRVDEFDQITTIPKRLRSALAKEFGGTILDIAPITSSYTRQAAKTLFALPDQHRVEAVAMQYQAGWHSYCISSQSGCGFGCVFCATGAIGLNRNLSADEITDQILFFHLNGRPIDSISLMGMGEALANPETFAALNTFTDKNLFGLSPRRITVSTIGVVPKMQRLTKEYPQVNLTFSLHSPFNHQRNQLIPLNHKYPIEEVMAVLDEHIRRSRRKVYVAYLLLAGVNDSLAHAHALAALLKERSRQTYLYHVNLIRHNPAVGIPIPFERPSEEDIAAFQALLTSEGIKVTTRQSFGKEIQAACGQLYGNYSQRKSLRSL